MQYDTRLFNQSQGMSRGFGAEGDYNIYSKPLFAAKSESIYKPKSAEGPDYGTAEEHFNKLKDTKKFKADKGFAGTEGGGGNRRDGPVQFEK